MDLYRFGFGRSAFPLLFGGSRQLAPVLRHLGPQQLEQAAVPGLDIAVGFDRHMPQQVQRLPGAGGRHVKQAPGFELVLGLVQLADIARGGGVLLFPAHFHRPEEQLGLAALARGLQPVQQFRLIAARAFAQPRQDDGVELQALGLVDAHQLQAAVGLRIGHGGEARNLLCQALRRERAAIGAQALQQPEIHLGVFRGGGIAERQRPAQRQPGALYPLVQGPPPAFGQHGMQHRQHAP